MSLTANIQSAAPHHAALVTGLRDVDYAPSALTQQQDLAKDLELQLGECDKAIRLLEMRTKKERQEYEAMRDSTARKLAHKLIGQEKKYKKKFTEEEREYVEALGKEMTEKSKRDKLKTDLDEAQKMIEDLVPAVEKHERCKNELAQLYEQLFRGPTPEAPEEDVLERALAATEAENADAQASWNAESTANAILADAASRMAQCMQCMRDAESASTMDIWGVGGIMADVMEKNHLSVAQSMASQAEMLLHQAQRIQPAIGGIGQLNVAQGGFADVWLDNIFSDLAFHEKIQQSMRGLGTAQARLSQERDAANRRLGAAARRASATAEVLSRQRAELYDTRRSAFERIAVGSGGSPVSASPPRSPSRSTGSFIAPLRPRKARGPPPIPPPPSYGAGVGVGSQESTVEADEKDGEFGAGLRLSGVEAPAGADAMEAPTPDVPHVHEHELESMIQSMPELAISIPVPDLSMASAGPTPQRQHSALWGDMDAFHHALNAPPSEYEPESPSSAAPAFPVPSRPNAVPAHWQSLNPYAALMAGRAHAWSDPDYLHPTNLAAAIPLPPSPAPSTVRLSPTSSVSDLSGPNGTMA